MDTGKKFHVWITLLLLWNGALLALVLYMLWINQPTPINPNDVAEACGTATLETMKDTCSNL